MCSAFQAILSRRKPSQRGKHIKRTMNKTSLRYKASSILLHSPGFSGAFSRPCYRALAESCRHRHLRDYTWCYRGHYAAASRLHQLRQPTTLHPLTRMGNGLSQRVRQTRRLSFKVLTVASPMAEADHMLSLCWSSQGKGEPYVDRRPWPSDAHCCHGADMHA